MSASAAEATFTQRIKIEKKSDDHLQLLASSHSHHECKTDPHTSENPVSTKACKPHHTRVNTPLSLQTKLLKHAYKQSAETKQSSTMY